MATISRIIMRAHLRRNNSNGSPDGSTNKHNRRSGGRNDDGNNNHKTIPRKTGAGWMEPLLAVLGFLSLLSVFDHVLHAVTSSNHGAVGSKALRKRPYHDDDVDDDSRDVASSSLSSSPTPLPATTTTATPGVVSSNPHDGSPQKGNKDDDSRDLTSHSSSSPTTLPETTTTTVTETMAGVEPDTKPSVAATVSTTAQPSVSPMVGVNVSDQKEDSSTNSASVSSPNAFWLPRSNFSSSSESSSTAVSSPHHHDDADNTTLPPKATSSVSADRRCAINLFGLPRAFRSLVLPSLVKHVIPHNPDCDYFLHAYDVAQEAAGRSGRGGTIHSDDVYLLRDAVHKVYPHASVRIVVESGASFDARYNRLLDKLHNTREPGGKELLYFPWKVKSFEKFKSMDNIVKMWHTIQAVWNLMETHAEQQQQQEAQDGTYESSSTSSSSLSSLQALSPLAPFFGRAPESATPTNITNTHQHPYYKRVGMIRSDVVYVTPLNIWELEANREDVSNTHLVIPNFARFPMNDRLAYGPYAAVRIWATSRFSRLDDHVQWMFQHDRGYGMHNERFVHYAILPAITQTPIVTPSNDTSTTSQNYTVAPRNDLCFYRARADESVWYTDCDISADPGVQRAVFNRSTALELLEDVLQRPCPLSTKRREMNSQPMFSVQCPANAEQS